MTPCVDIAHSDLSREQLQVDSRTGLPSSQKVRARKELQWIRRIHSEQAAVRLVVMLLLCLVRTQLQLSLQTQP